MHENPCLIPIVFTDDAVSASAAKVINDEAEILDRLYSPHSVVSLLIISYH